MTLAFMPVANRPSPHSAPRPDGCGMACPNPGIGIMITTTITTMSVRSVVLA